MADRTGRSLSAPFLLQRMPGPANQALNCLAPLSTIPLPITSPECASQDNPCDDDVFEIASFSLLCISFPQGLHFSTIRILGAIDPNGENPSKETFRLPASKPMG
jgi:hypothetical protein